MSYLGIEGCHAFVTGAAGGIGSTIAKELLAQGCNVTAHDLKPCPLPASPNLFSVKGDLTDEASIASCIAQAKEHFGPINILCANAGITNEANHPNIWEMPAETWDSVYRVNVRGTFLTIKQFLLSAKESQEQTGKELENLAVVVTGSECGKFGQAGHSEYASGKSALQYGLILTVKNEIVRLNSKARINAVAPGWVDTALIGDRLDDPRELYMESQGTVPLKKIAKPEDIAKAVTFLASHRASGHMSGQCLSVDGGMEGRIVWREEEVLGKTSQGASTGQPAASSTIPAQVSRIKPKQSIKVAFSIDFDAVSGWLGTGKHEDNNTSDYSQGYFSGRVGVPRLLKLLKKLGISDKVTWCIPGHSMETFPKQTKAIVDTGCEIALHGYSHESAAQMTAEQERDVLKKTMELAHGLTGKKVRGYRAPLYQLSERTIALLQEHDFLWDSSLTHDDSSPYFLPKNPAPVEEINFSPEAKASDWMHPAPDFDNLPKSNMVEIPCNWYAEDATPMQFYPHTGNSAGYVDARVMERMWMDRFNWFRSEVEDGKEGMTVYSIVTHPDTSGMAHIIGMIERHLLWLKSFGDEVEFMTYEKIAEAWVEEQKGKK